MQTVTDPKLTPAEQLFQQWREYYHRVAKGEKPETPDAHLSTAAALSYWQRGAIENRATLRVAEEIFATQVPGSAKLLKDFSWVYTSIGPRGERLSVDDNNRYIVSASGLFPLDKESMSSTPADNNVFIAADQVDRYVRARATFLVLEELRTILASPEDPEVKRKIDNVLKTGLDPVMRKVQEKLRAQFPNYEKEGFNANRTQSQAGEVDAYVSAYTQSATFETYVDAPLPAIDASLVDQSWSVKSQKQASAVKTPDTPAQPVRANAVPPPSHDTKASTVETPVLTYMLLDQSLELYYEKIRASYRSKNNNDYAAREYATDLQSKAATVLKPLIGKKLSDVDAALPTLRTDDFLGLDEAKLFAQALEQARKMQAAQAPAPTTPKPAPPAAANRAEATTQLPKAPPQPTPKIDDTFQFDHLTQLQLRSPFSVIGKGDGTIRDLPSAGDGVSEKRLEQKAYVQEIQRTLVQSGLYAPQERVDGIFGERTEDAVRRLQQKYGIAADGIVGKDTTLALQIEQLTLKLEASKLDPSITREQLLAEQRDIAELRKKFGDSLDPAVRSAAEAIERKIAETMQGSPATAALAPTSPIPTPARGPAAPTQERPI